jgi:hypothetical protein
MPALLNLRHEALAQAHARGARLENAREAAGDMPNRVMKESRFSRLDAPRATTEKSTRRALDREPFAAILESLMNSNVSSSLTPALTPGPENTDEYK